MSQTLKVQVSGMTCGGCSGRLKRLLERHSGIDSAQVSHEEGYAEVTGTVSEEEVGAIVVKAGFTVG